MKNVFLNVRTAKAQAECCAKVTKSSRMAKILTTLTLLLTLGVGQMWGVPTVRGFMNSWGCTEMTQIGSTGVYYYTATSNGQFKVQDGCNWDNDKKLSYYDNSLGNVTLSGKNDGGDNISCSQGGTWYIVYNGSKVYATTVDPSVPPTYTVTYNGNGKTSGSVPTDASSPYNSGSTVTVKGNTGSLAKTGYHFAGWNTAADYSGFNYAAGATFSISSNTTLYAKWVKTIYVYDNLNWGSMKLYTWDSNNGNKTYNGGWSGQALSQIGSTKWYQVDIVSGPNNFILNDGGSNQTHDIAIASYTPSITDGHSYETWNDNGTKKLREKTLTVSFNMKSHGSAVSSQSVYYNGLVTQPSPAPSATGYTFGGWYKETGCSNAWNFSTDKVTAARTLYAKWTANTYTVEYNANDDQYPGTASGSTTSSSHTYGTAKNLTSNGFSRTGYIFAGWATTPTGDVAYTDGQSVTNLSSTQGATVTLYAKWTAITLSATISPSTINANTATSIRFTITTNAPLSSGYYFEITNWGGKNSGTAGGYNIDGDHQITLASPFTYDLAAAKTNLDAGTYKIKLKITKAAVTQVESDLLTLTVSSSTYTVTVNAGAGGTVSPTSISASPDSWSGDITATPNAGYRFVNWTSSGGGITINNNTSATTQVKATSTGGTLTANFAAATYRVTLDNQSATTAGTEYVDATYNTTTLTSIAKPTKTNYTFGGYYTATGGGGIQIIDANGNWLASKSGFTDGSKKSIITENKILYAKWTETKYAVTVAVDNASHAAGNIDCTAAGWEAGKSGTAQIGNLTNVTITVGAAAAGYKFDGGYWTLTGGVTLISGNLTDPSITVKATAAGSATYTYAEDLTSTYYVEGDASGPFTYGWNANANTMMMKRTGYSTSSDVYWELEVPASKTSPGNNQWEFKIYNDASTTGEKWYGWGNGTDHHWLTKANNNLTLSTTGSNTIYLKCNVEGTYTFHVNYSTPASPTLEVSWPVVNQLRISSASPTDATNTNNFDLTDKGSNNWEVKRTLNANTTYTFKMVFDGAWYGDGTAFTRSNTSATGLTDGDNMTIKTDVAGEYTFTFNSSSKNLDITYPTAYTVTYGVGTSYTSMGSVSTSPSITSGNYVIAGTSIRFTATPNLGYKFVGWYREAACTNQVSTSNPYDLTINATTKLYAKFEVRNLYIHADWLSLGTAQMTQSTVNRAVYTYEIDNVAAAATSASDPYNNGYHFRFMNANNAGDDYLAYNYNGVQTPTGSGFLTNSDIHKTADRNPTIQYNLTHKSKITITLTLQSVDDATKPTVNIAADRYYDINYTAPSHGSYTIQVGAAGAVSANTEARAGTTITLANSPATGYHFGSWTVAKSAGTVTVTNNQFTMPSEDVTVSAAFTANTYRVQFHCNGGSGSTVYQNFTYDVAQNLTANTYTKTGYNFAGWALTSGAAVTYVDEANVSNLTSENGATFPLYAKWTPKTTNITLDQTGAATSGSVTTRTGTYDAEMPSISGANTLPVAPQGYAFMGYYDALEPLGTQYYNADGTSAHIWDKVAAETTLYAYYKKSEITAVVLNHDIFEPVAEATGVDDKDYVFANPTITPTPTPTTQLCWELRYSNDNPVAGDDYRAILVSGDQVKFKLVGLAAGGYKIHVELRTGGECGAGTLLSSYDKSFSIASDHIVTVQYKCGDFTLKAPTSVGGKPLGWSEVIEAASITGYTFNHWEAGEGVTIKDDEGEDKTTSTDATIQIKAIYDSKLTAVYTKKNMIYFYNTLGWSDVYVYFYSSDKYWVEDHIAGQGCGTGSDKDYSVGGSAAYYRGYHGHMTQIAGTNIWYYDYEAEHGAKDGGEIKGYDDVVFVETEQNNYKFFYNNKASRRGDFKHSLSMFVPLNNVTKTKNGTKYYNDGYWMNYPENTGYTLRIYSSQEATTPTRTIRFPFSADSKMPLKLDVELNEAAALYYYTIYREDGTVLSADYGMNTDYHSNVRLNNPGTKISIKTTAPGIYTFTLVYKNTPNLDYYISVDYPISNNDYRILYSDNATWSQGSAHTAGWSHPSDVIRKNTDAEVTKYDTVSFYIAKGEDITASMKFQYASNIIQAGTITWADVPSGSITIPSSVVTKPGVYNFIIKQEGTAKPEVEKVEPYTGNYYIRTDNAGSTKWDYYRASDHQMTYTEFSMSDANSFGEKYSHYFAAWCVRGTNIKFCIANDYSSCISDTLSQDVGNPYKNTDAGGTLKSDGAGDPLYDRYSANVRFMYNQETNKISRAYVASSTNLSRLFLVLRGDEVVKAEDGSTPLNDQGVSNGAILNDKENWIYERILYIKPNAKFKLFASYALLTPGRMDSVQYFRGAYVSGDSKASATFSDGSYVILISGTGGYQKARVIYDFKTNRLVCAWLPSDEPIDETLDINADVMVIRDHQNAAECITFSGIGSKLTDVKTVYGVMKFNRWTLNNRYRGKGGVEDNNKDHCDSPADIAEYHGILPAGEQKSVYERSLYFISFPFDVKVSEIFGFGTYGKHWVLEYYDGLNRAKNGYWIDSPANWKYVTPSMAKTYELKAYEGYILCLSLGRMAYDNTEIWPNDISNVELYFPSKVPMQNIQTINVTIPGLSDEYQCTINRGTPEGDRTIKDSYWRCLGVPSYDMYAGTLTSDGSTVINWQTDYSTFPFLYAWNMTDNTLTPQSTNRFSFKPMHAYLTQIGTAIYWTNVSATPASVMARQTEGPTEYNWCLTLNAGEQMIDQTYIRMSTDEHITNEFDFGQDLAKELNAGRSDIYSFIGYERAAANSMQMNTETTTIVPLGLNIEAAGEYTFSIPDGTNGIGITLIDEETGIRTSLSALDYTVELAAGDYTERFWLEISPVKGAETGIDPGVDARENGVRKVMIDGILYIVKDGKLFDARGARVE